MLLALGQFRKRQTYKYCPSQAFKAGGLLFCPNIYFLVFVYYILTLLKVALRIVHNMLQDNCHNTWNVVLHNIYLVRVKGHLLQI